MNRPTLTAMVFAVILYSAGSVRGQQCGDFNGSGGAPNAGDLSDLVTYVLTASGAPPADSVDADLDGRWGITIADVARLTDFLFLGGQPLLCGGGQDYHYATSIPDTLWIPFRTGIQDNVTTVDLPIVVHWETSTRYAYLPFHVYGDGSNGLFTFDSYLPKPGSSAFTSGDTLVVVVTETETDINDTVGYLRFNRIAAGSGDVVTDWVDRNANRRFAIEKSDYNLYRPTSLYFFPPGDVNCDGSVDIADLTYIVNYMFKGGPPPCKHGHP